MCVCPCLCACDKFNPYTSQIPCPGSRHCIHKDQWCDTVPDCDNRADERAGCCKIGMYDTSLVLIFLLFNSLFGNLTSCNSNFKANLTESKLILFGQRFEIQKYGQLF